MHFAKLLAFLGHYLFPIMRLSNPFVHFFLHAAIFTIFVASPVAACPVIHFARLHLPFVDAGPILFPNIMFCFYL